MPTDLQVNRVRESFMRADTEETLKSFYRCMMQRSPAIAAKFAHTDIENQIQLLRDSIFMVCIYASNTSSGEGFVEMLSKSHNRHGHNVSPEMYDVWVDCLMDTLAECDPEFTDDLKNDWLAVLNKTLDRMKQAY